MKYIKNFYPNKTEYLDFLVRTKSSIITEDIQKQDRLPIDILNDQDWDKINETYIKENIVVVDNFLKTEYTDRLRNFCLNYPFMDVKWEDYCALLFSKDKEDVWFPFLTNLTEDINNVAPFLKNTTLQAAWAHIYNNSSNGTAHR